MMIAIIAKDLFEHNNLLKEFLEKFDGFLRIKETSVGVAFRKFRRGYLVDQKDEVRVSESGTQTEEVFKIKEIDSKIISLTQINGRIKYTEIAEILNIEPSQARRHYEKLVKNNVIKKVTYTLNPKEAGIKVYRLLVQVYPDKELNESFFNFCREHPNIINYVYTIGNFQALLDVEVSGREELRDIIQKIQHNFPQIIGEIATNEIYKIEKFSQMAIEHPELEERISKSP